MSKLVRVNKSKWTPAQHRIWWLMNNQDDFHRISKWPAWAQESYVLAHKNDDQMFQLATFFNANGLDPFTAVHWTSIGDVIGGKGVPGKYSKKEIDAALRLEQRLKDGKIDLSKKRIFDMSTGKPSGGKGGAGKPVTTLPSGNVVTKKKKPLHPYEFKKPPTPRKRALSTKALDWRSNDPLYKYIGKPFNPYKKRYRRALERYEKWDYDQVDPYGKVFNKN